MVPRLLSGLGVGLCHVALLLLVFGRKSFCHSALSTKASSRVQQGSFMDCRILSVFWQIRRTEESKSVKLSLVQSALPTQTRGRNGFRGAPFETSFMSLFY
jgi:hypothetical protein